MEMLELSWSFERWGSVDWRGPTITGNCSTFELRTNMKKSLLLASLVAFVALAACTKKEETTVTAPAPAPMAAASASADASAPTAAVAASEPASAASK